MNDEAPAFASASIFAKAMARQAEISRLRKMLRRAMGYGEPRRTEDERQ